MMEKTIKTKELIMKIAKVQFAPGVDWSSGEMRLLCDDEIKGNAGYSHAIDNMIRELRDEGKLEGTTVRRYMIPVASKPTKEWGTPGLRDYVARGINERVQRHERECHAQGILPKGGE